LSKPWGVRAVYSDWKKMLREVRPDAVNICTPNGVHARPAIDAAAAGCHVLTEKPMAMNPVECRKMIDAARKAKVLLCVGFQFRYHPNTEYLVRAREAGQFGKVLFVKCQALRRSIPRCVGGFSSRRPVKANPLPAALSSCLRVPCSRRASSRPIARTAMESSACGAKNDSAKHILCGQVCYSCGSFCSAFLASASENTGTMICRFGGGVGPLTIVSIS